MAISRRVAFVDFEASGLGPDSYPLEVAWGFPDSGEVTAHLIRPALSWTDPWDSVASDLHGITPQEIHSRGRSAWDVAVAMDAALRGCRVIVTSPLDRFWLLRLFAEAPVEPSFLGDWQHLQPPWTSDDEALGSPPHRAALEIERMIEIWRDPRARR